MMSVRNLKVFMLCFVAVCSVQYTNLHTQNWRTIEQETDLHADTGPYIDVELLKGPTAVATNNKTNAVNNNNNNNNNNNTTIFPNRTNNNNNNTPIVIDIESKESFLWRGAQSRLCARIKKTTKKQNSSQLLLKLNIPCFKIGRKQQHGNYMLGLYAMRLAAMSFRADFAFECQEMEGKDSLMWWLQSKPNPPSVVDDDSLYTPRHPTKEIACKGMGRIGLHYVSEHVRKDFRAMATQIAASMEQQGRIIDDVAIHLRCGDILTKAISSKDSNYGLVHFEAYRKRIPNTAKSIGIVTAPFSEDHRRPQDHGSGTVCEELVSELTHYLESHFPEATIKVRNDPKESIPEVVSRLVMAQHNFCVRSTFCLLPSIASFGSSYLQEGGVAYFVDEVSKAYENIHLMDEGFLLSSEIRKKGWNATLSWLVSNSTTQENP